MIPTPLPSVASDAARPDLSRYSGFHLALLASIGFASACATAPAPAGPGELPTSVILFIADGAGAGHWTLAAFAEEDLAVGRMKSVGLVDTRGSDHTVSGSAPTATAYATGKRSFMGAVGVGPDSLPSETVLEVAEARGMSTGLMTTTFLADATPAAFGAHAVSRGQIGDIARQMSTKDIEVLMGGGRAAYAPRVQPDSSDLLAEVRQTYTYVETIDELEALDADSVDMLLGLFADGEMGVVAERGRAALQTMTRKAIEILDKNPNGFFLMVENEESDTQSHQNADEATITTEMLDFDRAVSIALDYQEANPGTLIIVTGDHETAGMTLPYDEEREPVLRWEWGGHTGVLIPLFASGPGAERFTGIIRNDRVGQILLELLRAKRSP